MIAKANSSVKPLGNDIDQSLIDRELQFDVGICRFEGRKLQGDDQLPGAIRQRDPQLAGSDIPGITRSVQSRIDRPHKVVCADKQGPACVRHCNGTGFAGEQRRAETLFEHFELV